MNLQSFREKINKAKGSRIQVQKTIDILDSRIKDNTTTLKKTQEAQLIIQLVAQKTQQQLEYHLNELVSLAMIGVFEDNAYQLKMRFDLKRGKTEVSPLFERNGKVRRPLKGTGFGQPDVASFVLRPTLWSLEDIRKRPIFLYDEPLRHLNDPTHRLHEKAAEMIQSLSKELGVQIIMITQVSELAEAANKIFHIDQENEKSFIIGE